MCPYTYIHTYIHPHPYKITLSPWHATVQFAVCGKKLNSAVYERAEFFRLLRVCHSVSCQ